MSINSRDFLRSSDNNNLIQKNDTRNEAQLDIIKDSMLLFSLTATQAIAGWKVFPYFSNKGICFANLLPNEYASTLAKINSYITSPNHIISQLFGLTSSQNTTAIAPVIEEAQFRGILQQLLLKKAPDTLLKKFFPDSSIDLDRLPIKVARGLVTALIFTTLHLQQLECENGGGLSTFFGSLMYSGLIEADFSLITTMSLHLMWNQYCSLLTSYLE